MSATPWTDIQVLRVHSPDEQRNCGNGDKTHSPLKDQPETRAAGYKTNPTNGKHCKRILTQDTDGSDKLDLLQRCEAKQRTRKASRRGSDLDNSTVGEAKIECKTEVDGGEKMLDNRDASKKKMLKHNRSKNGDPEVPSPGKSKDETEPTVEDLVSIGEEHINADREKQHESSITRESHSKIHPSSLPASSDVDAGRPLQAAGSGKILSKWTTTRSSSFSTNAERNKQKSTGVENFATNIRRTWNAAQDMLDLFLGPLLQKITSRR